ncbi:hypothetical protein FACS1894205_3130 [Alphaproteobacteria bacterium]|nr:hypothetical protein FACS1894205_3130 [Alphaproteobacteria bacterium]
METIMPLQNPKPEDSYTLGPLTTQEIKSLRQDKMDSGKHAKEAFKDIAELGRKMRADLEEGANRAGMTFLDYLETEEAGRILKVAAEASRKNPAP